MTRIGTIALGVALLAATAFAGAPDDDLAVVKKAVAKDQEAKAGPETKPEAKVAPAAARKGERPQWLRVRVVDKGAKKAKVSINLPLSLAHALGDDVPIDLNCHRRHSGDREGRCKIRLSEILTALESGQDLVEIDDEEATVRVWVE